MQNLPFPGATGTNDGYDGAKKERSVRVTTGKLKKPLTLEILACGSRAA